MDKGRKKNRIERERNKKGDFPDIPTIESRRFESKSRSTYRRLHVGTKILKFRKTPRGKEFSHLDYFYLKCHLMA